MTLRKRVVKCGAKLVSDRIITATALHLNLPLLTRDTQIARFDLVTVVWEDEEHTSGLSHSG